MEDPNFHEYLTKEDYYEVRSVAKSRKVKYCEHCGKTLPIGCSHDVHTFYPEFSAYATHKICTAAFLASLRP